MRSHSLVLVPALAILMTLGTASSSWAQFDQLVKYIPDSTNTVILYNAEKVFSSPVAQREGWRKNYEKAFSEGLVRLPVDARQFIAASQLDFESMTPRWEVGVIVTEKAHSMAEVASTRKGTLTTIVGKEAVLLPDNTFIIKLADNIYGSMSPADRQELARWIRTADAGASPAAYIQEAVGYAKDAGTEVVMAIDVQDAVNAAHVEEALATSPAMTQAKLDPKRVAGVLASAKGIMLGITFADRPFGKIKVDFGTDAAVLQPAVKPLFLEALGNRGLMIDDLNEWKGGVSGAQATLEGYFSQTGLRRVFSLIDVPASSELTKTPEVQSGSDADAKQVASQKYFQGVTKLLTELRNEDSPRTYAQIGSWFDKYARRVDRLPMLNVDDEVLDYGQYVAQQLRNCSMAIKGVGIQSRPAQIAAAQGSSPGGYNNYTGNGNGYYDGNYYYNGYAYRGGNGAGFYNYQAGLQAQQQARTQVKVNLKAQGSAVVQSIMNDVKNVTADMRRKMTQKYNVEF